MDDFYVYVHTRNDTGRPFYVGKGRAERAHRVSQRSPHWSRIVAKHGRGVHLVAQNLPDELALLAEVELIDQFRRRGLPLVNLTEGGDGARLLPHAEERRLAAIRAANLRPDVQAKRVENSRRIASTPELLERRSAAIREAYQRPDLRAKLIANARSEKALVAHRAAMARPEVREKLRQALALPVVCVETGQRFPMVLAAAEWLRANVNPKAQPGHICQCCKGQRKRAYGYHWRYLTKGDHVA